MKKFESYEIVKNKLYLMWNEEKKLKLCNVVVIFFDKMWMYMIVRLFEGVDYELISCSYKELGIIVFEWWYLFNKYVFVVEEELGEGFGNSFDWF